MGNSKSSSIKINYEDVQFIIKNPEGHILHRPKRKMRQTFYKK
jgi:hypothetical protein